MAKKSTKKAVTKEVAPKEEVIKDIQPSAEEVSEAKAEKKADIPTIKSEGTIKLVKEYEDDVYAEVKKPLDPPLIEVEEITALEPDTIDEFAVFKKAKAEDKGKVWVKDHNLLKKVEGRQFTLGGTQYLGTLKDTE